MNEPQNITPGSDNVFKNLGAEQDGFKVRKAA